MRSHAILQVFGVTLVVLGACSDERTPAVPPPGPAVRAGASRAEAPRPMPGEEYLYQIEGEVPGFAGMYYDDAGDLVVSLKDLRLSGQATAAVRRHLPGPGKRGRREGPPATIRFRQAEYSFVELNGYWRRVNQVVLGIAGVVSTDVDEESNRVVVAVRRAAAEREVRDAVAAASIPQGSVQVRMIEPCTNLDSSCPPQPRSSISGRPSPAGS